MTTKKPIGKAVGLLSKILPRMKTIFLLSLLLLLITPKAANAQQVSASAGPLVLNMNDEPYFGMRAEVGFGKEFIFKEGDEFGIEIGARAGVSDLAERRAYQVGGYFYLTDEGMYQAGIGADYYPALGNWGVSGEVQASLFPFNRFSFIGGMKLGFIGRTGFFAPEFGFRYKW